MHFTNEQWAYMLMHMHEYAKCAKNTVHGQIAKHLKLTMNFHAILESRLRATCTCTNKTCLRKLTDDGRNINQLLRCNSYAYTNYSRRSVYKSTDGPNFITSRTKHVSPKYILPLSKRSSSVYC